MKLFTNPGRSPMEQRRQWKLSALAEAAEDAVDEVAEEVEAAETGEVAVAAEMVATANKALSQPRVRARRGTQSTKPPDMQTSLHSRPAGAIGPMDDPRTIVRIQDHAPGKTSGCPSQICNETGTSSDIRMTSKLFTTSCTETSKKYMKFILTRMKLSLMVIYFSLSGVIHLQIHQWHL